MRPSSHEITACTASIPSPARFAGHQRQRVGVRDTMERGTVVWASLRGFPPWPATIRSRKTLQGQASYKVRFFATKDVANVGASAVTLFNERLELCDRPHFGMDFGKVKKGTLFKKYQVACRCLLYTSPSPRDRTRSRMPSSA